MYEKTEQSKLKQMEIVGQLQKQYVDFTTSLFREGYLDDQYVQLQKLKDESNPEFVVEVVSIFFEDSEKLLNDLACSLQQQVVDFKKVDGYVHQFKGSSSRCLRYLNLVKQEFYLVKSKLETLSRLERQILQAGGTVPLIESCH
ncbi:histidine-containing phosphotransfer protein 1-like isoform X3 [Olea europaea var. sylvestris]|uniref:histidine-containing phosphotransfer protein 1-like isoform X3 n=1 Tax=Olea europaea var. sylvestris TaxID=158386 RepID=UPI000C1D6B54|nr:histidine-containing phosphotransfer protein 1-like isoform X3 [Olea europaea var. sylvestris]